MKPFLYQKSDTYYSLGFSQYHPLPPTSLSQPLPLATAPPTLANGVTKLFSLKGAAVIKRLQSGRGRTEGPEDTWGERAMLPELL